MIFWILLIIVIIAIFQCTQNSEANKSAPTLMYERLYQCSAELDSMTDSSLIQHIQNTVALDMTQSELMGLIAECKKANPMKTKQDYINAIKLVN